MRVFSWTLNDVEEDTVTEARAIDEREFVPVKSADRTLEVLESLATGGASLAELSARLGIPKSSLHSILRTIESRGWVETDASRSHYRLGVSALLMASSFIDHDPTVRRTSRILDALAHDTGETVHLARLELPDVVYIAKREAAQPTRTPSAIGRRLPAHSTALGKAMLAELPDHAVHALLPAELPGATPHTIRSRDALVEHLSDVRAQGYAVDAEEAGMGMRCYAVTVPSRHPARDAISCSVPTDRLDPRRERAILDRLFAARESLMRRRTA